MIKKLKNKAVQFSLGLLPVFCLTACGYDSINSIGLGNYKTETFVVDDPEYQTQPLSKDQYSIDQVCSLSLPENIKIFGDVDLPIVKNNRIYIRSTDMGDGVRVLAFDTKGHFLYQTEKTFDGKKNSFFVDNEGRIHVFDSWNPKVYVFDRKGKLSKTERAPFDPYAFGMTENGRYLFAYSENACGSALNIYDKNNILQKKLIPFGQKYVWGATCSFSQNGNRLSHAPFFSDSVLVFRNDTLEKVVRVDFKGQYIMDKNPEAVTNQEKTKELNFSKDIKGISKYQETDSLICFGFDLFPHGPKRLIRKSTKETLSGWDFFEGFAPFDRFYLLGNQLVAIVDELYVETINSSSKDDAWMDKYNKSAPQVQALIDGKIKTPAVFFISLKWDKITLTQHVK